MRLRPLPVLATILLAAHALVLAAPAAHAQSWPTKPITAILPFGAGSATDVVARLVLDQVSAQIGQSIVVENRAGAGSTTGSALVAKAEPDGYTLLATSSAFSVAPTLYPKLPYDPIKDFVPIAIFGGLPNVMIVPANAPHKTLAELVAFAKANPRKLNFVTLGMGSGVHMAAERFRLSAGYQAVPVAFKGGAEGLTEIVAGRIDYYFCPVNTALPFIRDGKVRALAVSIPKRLAVLPDVPTTLEAGFRDSDSSAWVGLLAPARTPTAVIERLHKEVTAALQTEKVREKLVPNGIEMVSVTPAAFAAQIAEELKINAALAKALAVKAN
jgi:tripartite-type tricarboxylate transporter receptor subunit TctC